MRQTRLVIVAMAAALSACASDYGGSLAGNQDVLSPEERRLQALENHVAQMQRRLDALNASNIDQQSQQTRQDVSQLRGDLEKLRYDFDQSQRQQADLEARVQRLEGGAAAGMAPGVAGAYMPQNGAVQPGATGQAPMPGAGTAAAAAAATPDDQSTPVVTPAQTPSQPAAAAGAVTLSNGGGASPQEEAAYLSAFDSLKNGKYDDALRGFRAQLEKWPQGRYADNALYWSGEAYYVKADYKSALAAFQAVLQRFPRSAKAPDAMLKSGLVQMDMGQTSAGKATLQKVVSTYPQSNAASLAQQRLQSK
ncbi:tol-pal system protein YbgF [Solimonas marina]|uniref:Cell division coordinator CpoB n=1 Tax=Solimonas marina TaxID=2714601 RepID=A0A970BBA3_9GAMM|nr:tol-pal system protein YbgF [Solimonas marina]NKF24186.1 tol-pal system protein YbgF [Solimonas marina]